MPDPFQQVVVTFNPEGGTKVVWAMTSRFRDPLPHRYQLQSALSSAPTADDFINVGPELNNTFFAIDHERRVKNKRLEDANYRVRLTTSRGVYYSPVVSNRSYLNPREYLHVRDMVRQTLLAIRRYTGCYEGYLFKQKRFGVDCRNCTNKLTGDVSQESCPVCLGTGYETGYYAAIPNFWMQLGLEFSIEKVDTNVGGTTRPLVITGVCAANIILNSQDIFLALRSGARWSVESVKTLAEYRGHPITFELSLRLLPVGNVAYQIPIEGL